MNRMLHNSFFSKNKNSRSLFLKPALVVLGIVFCFVQVMAQKPVPAVKAKPVLTRCGTMEGIAELMLTDPELKARVEQNERDFQNWLNNPNSVQSNRPASPASLPGPVTIPVVVHVVLPNPWIITDEAVDYFIARLNEDFAGTNADSTNGATFYNVRGHSLLRFIRARRDPQGNFTTGIVRKVGTTLITGGNQPIKNSNTATGGSTGWDVSKYYNFYVGDGGPAGLLGISPGIGPGSSVLGSGGQDGVCVDFRSFANLCFSYPQYNLSRTGAHEIGHNFGLYHIWGDNNPCVTGADFRQLSSAGCSLPTALLGANDDTPNQSTNTGGCPNGNVSNNCNPAVAKMYQNYMDYTDDACYSMFSIGQSKRMEWVLENCRPGYLTTLGGQYPSIYPLSLDAMINSVVSPGGAEVFGNGGNCDTVGKVYPQQKCEGAFIPKLRITNAGNTALTSVTVTTSINGVNLVTQTIAVNIPFGRSQVVTLSPQDAVPGVNNLKFELSAPNGGADGNPINDTLTYKFTVAVPIALPYVENFTLGAFPPNNGSSVDNPDGPQPATPDGTGIGWARSTNAGRPGPASMWINLYNYATVGQRDQYRIPPINTTNYDSVRVSFYVAYKQYFGTDVPAPPIDSLKLIYSNDCGSTWRTVYAKGGSGLATVAGTTDSSFRPFTNSQWRKETVTINDFCGTGAKNILVAFESYNDFGNNIYVDSINAVGFTSVDTNATVLDIVQPATAFCNSSLTPIAVISNAGNDTLTSVTVNYSIDNGPVSSYNWTGSLAKCENVSITLASANVSYAAHSIKVFTSNPNGGTDQVPGNDALTKEFTVFNTATTPVREDFNDNVFPPLNWAVINSIGGGATWERKLPAIDPAQGAMRMNNRDAANNTNSVDYFISPIVENSAANDSVFVDFDMAYQPGANYPGSTVLPLDTLELLATTDCGATFTSVWKKWGDGLQTINDPNYSWGSPFVPKAGEWKKQRAYLTPFVGAANFQLYFTMKGNKQNNLWIDNINITSQILPQRLKDQGYLIYPNPFNSTFLIHHSAVEPPVDLQAVLVYNSAGQLVWSKEYKGNAERQITVNLKNAANGLYVLKMIYSNRTVIEKIIKTQ